MQYREDRKSNIYNLKDLIKIKSVENVTFAELKDKQRATDCNSYFIYIKKLFLSFIRKCNVCLLFTASYVSGLHY